MAHKPKTKHKAKRSAKKRSGLIVGTKSGRNKKAHKRSGMGNAFDTFKGAFLAAAAMRAGSGFVGYIARTNNMGQDLPKMKVAFPAAILGLSWGGVIQSRDIFVASTQATVDALVDNTEFLREGFDFKWLDKKPTGTPKPDKGLTIRQLAQRAQIPRTTYSGYSQENPLSSQMADRGLSYKR